MATYNLGNIKGPKGDDATINGISEATITNGSGVTVITDVNAKIITIGADSETAPYDNSGTTLESTTIANAIDELSDKIDPYIDLSDAEVYSFFIDTTKSIPDEMIVYPSNARNANYTPVRLNASNVFDYGDWGDAFFIKNTKPCMLKFDGTVDYYLNKANYNQKADGTAHSNLNNESYAGNAMVEFPQIWICVSTNSIDGASEKKPRIFVANKNLSNATYNYHAFAHTDYNGNIIDKIYMPAYEGSKDSSNRLRSLAGKAIMVSQTGSTERSYAQANNTAGSISNAWDMSPLCDHELLMILCLLISKTTNNQDAFGKGLVNLSAQTSTGQTITSGFFAGTTADGTHAVKVFGIENPWGNVWMRKTGCVHDANGHLRIKMIPPYVTDPASETALLQTYEDLGIGNGHDGYLKECKFNEFGIFPFNKGGSETTYYCDYMYGSTSAYKNTFALFGDRWDRGGRAGLFCWDLSDAVSHTYATLGSSVCCKPLAA